MKNNCAEKDFIKNILSDNSKAVARDLGALNWSYILNYAFYHKIAGILYKKLTTAQILNSIPSNASSALENFYYETLTANMRFWQEFLRLQKIFDSASIKIIPIKGIILTNTLYEDFGLRPMRDIDILVQKKDLLSSINLLFKDGYELTQGHKLDKVCLEYYFHIPLYHPEKNILVELHKELSYPRPNKIDYTCFWKRAKLTVADNQKTLDLTPEDALLSLVIHYVRHLTSLQCIRLINLYDISKLLLKYKEKLDWEYLKDRINTWGLNGGFYYLLLLIESNLDCPNTGKIKDILRPSRLTKNLSKKFTLTEKPLSNLRNLFLMFLLLDANKHKLLLLLKLLRHSLFLISKNRPLLKAYLKNS